VDPYQLIRDAILNKRQVLATYHGHRREMCPHVLGTKRGSRHALFYQFGGSSSSGIGAIGSGLNWRCVLIDWLSDVEVRDGPWYTAPTHSRPQTCVDSIDVEVEY